MLRYQRQMFPILLLTLWLDFFLPWYRAPVFSYSCSTISASKPTVYTVQPWAPFSAFFPAFAQLTDGGKTLFQPSYCFLSHSCWLQQQLHLDNHLKVTSRVCFGSEGRLCLSKDAHRHTNTAKNSVANKTGLHCWDKSVNTSCEWGCWEVKAEDLTVDALVVEQSPLFYQPSGHITLKWQLTRKPEWEWRKLIALVRLNHSTIYLCPN